MFRAYGPQDSGFGFYGLGFGFRGRREGHHADRKTFRDTLRTFF